MDQVKMLYLSLEAAFVGATCFIIGDYISSLIHDGKGYIDGLWCTISSLVVLQSLARDALKSSKSRVVGTMIASIVSGIICYVFGYNYGAITSSIAISAYLMNLMKMKDGVRIATATSAVITGYGFINPDYSSILNATMRSIDTIIGVSFSLFIVFISYILGIRKF